MPKYNPTALYLRQPMREHLSRILETPLTVVEAPMGYGKTTAVREFVQSSGAFVLWKTLDSDLVSSFWQGFVRLIGKVDPDCAQKLSLLGCPDTAFFLEEVLVLLENVPFPHNTVLVIDDYHLLLSAEADRFIESLIKAEMPNLHVVIISRVVFGEKATELTLKGYCTLIDKKCFELTRQEIVEYYKTCGVRLTQQEADELFSYTEGWISALYLCLLVFLQEGRIEKQSSLHHLLEKFVYQQSSDEMKDFLLTVCIFDNFSLEQAEAMWRSGPAKSLLKNLMTRNAFITYDSVNRTYQMHNILTGFLRELFDRKSLQEKKLIWHSAGEWLTKTNHFMQALEYFYKAEDYDRLLSVLELNKGNAVTMTHLGQLRQYFRDCPPEVIAAHPRASLTYALELFANNEYELFAAQCEIIRESIEGHSQLAPEEKDQLTGELEFLLSFSQYNRIQAMTAHYLKARLLMKKPTEFFDRNGSWSFESPSVLYMFHREVGQLEQEMRDLAEGVNAYYPISDSHGFGAEYVMQAERHYLCGEIENADIAAHAAVHAAESKNQISPFLAALFVHLRIALLRGNVPGISGILERMRDKIRQQGSPAYLRTLDLCEGFLFATLSDSKKIPDWIGSGTVQESPLPFPTHGFYNIIYGKTLLLHGKYTQFLGLAPHFQMISSVFPNLLGQLYAHIQEAEAHKQLGHDEKARESLRQALDMALPDQLLLPFVENGAHLLPLLKELSTTKPAELFIHKVAELYAKYAKNIATVQHSLAATNTPLSLLTPRELEVARLVASGLTNQRIAALLFVTEATVKKALQNIFLKLHLNNRTALTKIFLEQTTA